MGGILTIMWKEICDNLRDKRTLFFALIYGPLLMPSLMLGPLVVEVDKATQHYDSGREMHIVGETRAPNFVAHLKSKNLDPTPVDNDFKQKIIDGDIQLVVEITETYGEQLQQGIPAKVIIHYDKQAKDSQSIFWQVRAEIDHYGRTMAAQRMAIRGFDQKLLRPIDITENDLSEEEFGSGILSNIILFLVIFSCMMGGFYLAVDITAGERERNSLEPLLSLALSRTQIALGKYLAIFLFCCISFLLPILSAGIWASFLPDQFFGDADVPSLMTYLKITLLALPIGILLSSTLMVIATFSKSVKEAQTQLGMAMILPMLPFFAVQFMDVKLNSVTSTIPILSQYLLADKIMLDTTYPLVHQLPGAVSCILLAGVFLSLAIYLYKQDSILGD